MSAFEFLARYRNDIGYGLYAEIVDGRSKRGSGYTQFGNFVILLMSNDGFVLFGLYGMAWICRSLADHSL